MIHLRLVLPPQCIPETFDFLESSASVINLVWLPGAARKPDGDVIQCDVAREDASRVLTVLREQRVHKNGTIAIEYVDTAISDAAREAERVAPGAVSDAVIWESVRARTFEDADLSFTFLAFMVLAALLTSMAILTDSLVILIGGMIVGPEFGPLAGIAVASVEGRWNMVRRSATALAVGFPVGIAAAFLLTLALKATEVAPSTFPDREATFFISHPDTYSVLVALFAGVAGTLSLTTIKSGPLIGVLVSVTTIPAAANIAVAAAYADWGDFGGSALQLSVNLGCIIGAGVATLAIERWAYARRKARRVVVLDEG